MRHVVTDEFVYKITSDLLEKVRKQTHLKNIKFLVSTDKQGSLGSYNPKTCELILYKQEFNNFFEKEEIEEKDEQITWIRGIVAHELGHAVYEEMDKNTEQLEKLTNKLERIDKRKISFLKTMQKIQEIVLEEEKAAWMNGEKIIEPKLRVAFYEQNCWNLENCFDQYELEVKYILDTYHAGNLPVEYAENMLLPSDFTITYDKENLFAEPFFINIEEFEQAHYKDIYWHEKKDGEFSHIATYMGEEYSFRDKELLSFYPIIESLVTRSIQHQIQKNKNKKMNQRKAVY